MEISPRYSPEIFPRSPLAITGQAVQQRLAVFGYISAKNTGMPIKLREGPLNSPLHGLDNQEQVQGKPDGVLFKGSGDATVFRFDPGAGNFRGPDDGIFQRSYQFRPDSAKLGLKVQ
jgi:hypothetical protein